jgi:SAM-dependent methyltransferase
MSDDQGRFDATAYWNKRYDKIDASRSGHVDLPVEYNAWLYRRKQDHVAKALATVHSSLQGKRLLEIAAGSGAWIDFWRAQGVADYVGIDISENAINGLKTRFPALRFQQRDLNDPGLAEAVGTGYDHVSAIDVLYHVVDDDRFRVLMSEIASLLKPGGLLIIHDQFVHGPASDHVYLRWRPLAEYVEILSNAGFEVLYRRPTFFFMIQAVDLKPSALRMMDALWEKLIAPSIRRFPRVAGAIGYVVDTMVCALLREGPSMEMMVCRKRS